MVRNALTENVEAAGRGNMALREGVLLHLTPVTTRAGDLRIGPQNILSGGEAKSRFFAVSQR